MSAQRARSAVVADHRSAHPNLPGVPWWGAVLIAVTGTAIGFAFDAGSGSKELSAAFAACYVLSCIAAVLAVRQAAVFTAVIQPPLILFAAVPGAYFLFTGGQNSGVRDLLINCGYPLIERFPLMFFTSATVLVIGMVRWYYGTSTRHGADRSGGGESTTSVASALTSKVSSLWQRDPEEVADKKVTEPPRRRRPSESRSERPTRSTSGSRERPARRSAPSRSRHVRPPETEVIEPVAERPRRTRSSRQQPASSDRPERRERRERSEVRDRNEPRRRPRPPRQSGPPPSERRRFEDFNLDYQPREPHGRSSANGNGTHHPISRVRYRGEEHDERAEYRSRHRTTRERDVDSWDYDI